MWYQPLGDQQSPVGRTLVHQTGINGFTSSTPSAAQPLTTRHICRAGYNLLLDRRSSIFINQKSPHFVLLSAVQIIRLWVLSIPSPAVLWPPYLQTPRTASILPAFSWGIFRGRAQSWEQRKQKMLERQKVVSQICIQQLLCTIVCSFSDELHERRGLKPAAVPWDIGSESSQVALQQAGERLLFFCNSGW